MRVFMYKDIPYAKLSHYDIFADLFINRKYYKKTKRKLSFINKNREILKKMQSFDERFKPKTPSDIKVVSKFLDDILADVVHQVYEKGYTAVYKNYRMVSVPMQVDEVFMEAKKEAEYWIDKKYKKKSHYSTPSLNDTRRLRTHIYRRVHFYDVRNRSFYIQLFCKTLSNKKVWKGKTRFDILATST